MSWVSRKMEKRNCLDERAFNLELSRHASAYDSLKSELGRKITRNLGLPNGENAKQCLSCHSTYVPDSQRGERFSLTDGVTCESCHGPGGNFCLLMFIQAVLTKKTYRRE